MKSIHVHLSDLQGYSRLAVQATVGVTDLVEAMHHTILRLPGPLDKHSSKPASAAHRLVEGTLRTTSGLIYSAVRGISNLVGGGLDVALRQLQPEVAQLPSSAERAAFLSILNGVLGDHLTTHANPLAITMGWYQGGKPLEIATQSLAMAIPQAQPRILVLLHGHCMNELQWTRNGHNHGELLAAAHGMSPVYLRYNTGQHISSNGRALADQLQSLVDAWPVPVEQIDIVGYSMGGLLARSALHYGTQAGDRWIEKLGKLVFIGTPHHGSMVERAGNMLDVAMDASPYSRAFTRLGKIRSAGTTDLRFGNLLDEDWHDRDRFAPGADPRQSVPLPQAVSCYAIAGMIAWVHGDLQSRWVGDGLVPLSSALGHHKDPRHALAIAPDRQKTVYGATHLGLLDSQAVADQLQEWFAIDSAKG
ncbi:MAG: GPI inositol-deacylase [Rhodoferax sp.]|nr:GPI inositol-deacylase [Rhodoferax sp.]